MFNKTIFKVTTIFLSLFLSMSVLAQKTNDQLMREFLEQRKRMMEEIMKTFNDKDVLKGFDDNFFKDDFFEEFKKHGMGGLRKFGFTGQMVSIEEKVNKDGSIDILIRPKDKNIKLDINTTEDQIIISGESFVSEENQSEQNHSHSTFKSTFSKSISVPNGFQALPAQPIEGGLQIKLVQKDKDYFKKNKMNQEKSPIGKRPGERTI